MGESAHPVVRGRTSVRSFTSSSLPESTSIVGFFLGWIVLVEPALRLLINSISVYETAAQPEASARVFDHYLADASGLCSTITHGDIVLTPFTLRNPGCPEERAMNRFNCAVMVAGIFLFVALGVGLGAPALGDDDPEKQGDAFMKAGEYDRAIAAYSEALKLQPKNVNLFSSRGRAYERKNELEKAIADYDEAIRIDPKNYYPHLLRGNAHRRTGRYDRAVADLKQGNLLLSLIMDLESSLHAQGENVLAWVLATCPDDKVRNGAEAVKWATSAVFSSGRKIPDYLDTLAAAHAEAGQFDKAVEIQKNLLGSFKNMTESKRKGYEAHLKLFEERKPVRDGVPPKKPTDPASK